MNPIKENRQEAAVGQVRQPKQPKQPKPGKALCLVLTGMLLLYALSGCGTMALARADDLMSGVQAQAVVGQADLTGASRVAVADFGVTLFRQTAQTTAEENTLISPLSVLCALAMTANGAGGETQGQMAEVFGLGIQELNQYLYTYRQSLTAGEKYKLSLANSIWLKEGAMTAEKGFLQTNKDFYDAAIYQAAFDQDTCRGINQWVNKHTDGMIKEILGQIPEDAVMYLVNALAFEAEWQRIYQDNQVRPGEFTTLSGNLRQVDMMYGGEYAYLEDEGATGFIKDYAEGKYAFVALLPKEGVSLAEYVAGLTGEGLLHTLEQASDELVYTALPKFTTEYAVTMGDILADLGMPLAFDPVLADFSGMGQAEAGNIFISQVIHKTYIAVDERGTKAGAATVVAMSGSGAMIAEPKEVYLDRPFVYLLIDRTTNLPFFIGQVVDTGK